MADLQPLLPRRIAQSVFPPIGDTSNDPPTLAPLGQAAMGGGLQSLLPAQSPNVTLNNRIGDSNGSRQSLLEADLYKRENPIAPTTTLGKIGHVAAGIGNVLGNIFAPATMALIPGTELHSQIQKNRDIGELDDISSLQNQADQRKQTEAQTAYTTARPAIEQAKILQKLTTALAPKGIKASMNPDGTIDTEDDPDSQAYKNQVALAGMHNATSQFDQIKSENADNKYQPGTPQYEEWNQRLLNAQKQMQIHLASLGLSRERLGFQEDKTYNPQPTSQERNKGDMANSAADQIADMKDIVQRHPQYFGPGFGQSQAFQKWIGSQDPDAQRFLSAQTIAADHLAATFGGRSDAALSALHNALGNFRDNPEAATAALNQLTKANTVFQQAGKTHNREGVLQPQQSSQPSSAPKVRKFNLTTGRLE